MKLLLSFGLLLVSNPAFAQAPAESAPQQTIVVTAQRLQDYRDRLAACLARHCPPNEDVDASLALAEALFVNGDYHHARQAIRASLSRNRGRARDYPEPVSDLYRANALVARHLGMDRDADLSTYAILRALRAGLPTEDYRHFTARLEIADSLARYGYRYYTSQRELRELAERARLAGRDDAVAMAELRLLWLDYLQGPWMAPPSRTILEMARSADPRRAIGAKMMLVRIYSRRGDTARADAVIAELGRSGQRRPILYNPTTELLQREFGGPQGAIARGSAPPNPPAGEQARGANLTSNLADLMVDHFEDKWVEVGFWIRPDGRVEELEIVRHRNGAGWSAPILQSIRGRRYAAYDSRTYRLERYTYTSALRDVGGSHIRGRSPGARIEYFDLSEGATHPAPTTP